VSWDPPAACVTHLDEFTSVDHGHHGLAVHPQNRRHLIDRQRHGPIVEDRRTRLWPLGIGANDLKFGHQAHLRGDVERNQ